MINVVGGLLTTAVLAVGGISLRAWRARRSGGGWTLPDNPQLFRETRVLIIDDQGEEELAHIEQLRTRGFHVERWPAVRPDRCMRLELEFDLLLLDNRGVSDPFGATSGVSAAELLRRDNPWIPIFLFTSYPEDVAGAQKRALTQTKVRVLSKMTRFAELEEVVVKALYDARRPTYFVELLEQRGVDAAAEVLEAFVKKGERPHLDGLSDPYARTQVDRILAIASDIYTGKRWDRTRSKGSH